MFQIRQKVGEKKGWRLSFLLGTVTCFRKDQKPKRKRLEGILSGLFFHLFILVRATMYTWRLDVSLQVSVLSFNDLDSRGSDSSCQAWPHVPLPTEPSHWLWVWFEAGVSAGH